MIDIEGFLDFYFLLELFLLTVGLKMSLYTFLANIDDADNTEESADDITAAETAPRPKNETKAGVRYCKTIGKIIR